MKHFIHVPLVLREVENQIFQVPHYFHFMDYAPEAQEMLKSFWFNIVFISTCEKGSDTIQKSQGTCRAQHLELHQKAFAGAKSMQWQ